MVIERLVHGTPIVAPAIRRMTILRYFDEVVVHPDELVRP
jgi:hypothetical protein